MRKYAKAVNVSELQVKLVKANLRISGLLTCRTLSENKFSDFTQTPEAWFVLASLVLQSSKCRSLAT